MAVDQVPKSIVHNARPGRVVPLKKASPLNPGQSCYSAENIPVMAGREARGRNPGPSYGPGGGRATLRNSFIYHFRSLVLFLFLLGVLS